MKAPVILALMAAAVTAPFAKADIINKVNLSGTIATLGTPVVSTHGATSTSVQKLVAVKVTNATVLDSMVGDGTLVSKTGYALVEIFNDDGTSQGFFARNTRTGDRVPVANSLLSGFTSQNLITAKTTTTATGSSGSTTAVNATSFTGSAESTINGAPASVYLVGQTTARNFNNRVSGASVKVPYTGASYTALIRGVSTAGQVINAKLVSTGGVYELTN